MKEIIINNLHHRHIVCTTFDCDGDIIYKGHKLGINRGLLPFILQYWFDRFHGKFQFVDYYKWNKRYSCANLDREMVDCLFSDTDSRRGLDMSYESLLNMLTDRFGRYSKINIVQK